MKVLVTGGAGFIGSHVVDALIAAGHLPVVLDDLSSGSVDNLPEGVKVYRCDIRDAAEVRTVFDDEQPEAVCHQAAQISVSHSVSDPRFDAEVNCVGLLNVLDAAARAGCLKFVFASSGGVLYGDVAEPASEDSPIRLLSPYGISKMVGEKYLEFYARRHGMACIALRYSNVYGPRQNPHGEAGVVAIFCKRMLAGEGAVIHGDGGCLRDYVPVADVAAANRAALELATHAMPASKFLAFNIGTGIRTNVSDIESKIRKIVEATTGKTVPVPTNGPERDGDLRSSVVSPWLAERMLGFTVKKTLQRGLEETVKFFTERETA